MLVISLWGIFPSFVFKSSFQKKTTDICTVLYLILSLRDCANLPIHQLFSLNLTEIRILRRFYWNLHHGLDPVIKKTSITYSINTSFCHISLSSFFNMFYALIPVTSTPLHFLSLLSLFYVINLLLHYITSHSA